MGVPSVKLSGLDGSNNSSYFLFWWQKIVCRCPPTLSCGCLKFSFAESGYYAYKLPAAPVKECRREKGKPEVACRGKAGEGQTEGGCPRRQPELPKKWRRKEFLRKIINYGWGGQEIDVFGLCEAKIMFLFN